MSTIAAVTTWQRRLAGVAVVNAVLLATGAGLTVFAVSRAAGLGFATVLGLLTAVVVMGVVLVRAFGKGFSVQQVALWLEERAPGLRYALVSALHDGPSSAWCAEQVARVPVDAAAWQGVRRALRWPGVVLALGAVSLLLPAAPQSGTRASSFPFSASPAAVLTPLRVRVTAPGYAKLPVRDLGDARQVRALAGSLVSIDGPVVDSLRDLVVSTEGASIPVRLDDGRWRVALTMDTVPRVIAMRHRREQRLLILEPVRDSAPVVTIDLPASDTVLRVAEGTLALRATALDDFGVREAWFEYIITSGEGERFTFRTARLPGGATGGRTSTSLSASLSLASLQLLPGDVMHVRALAEDGSTVHGPGRGASDTRSVRIARLGEYDSVAVDAAPPARADSALLSQRMIINLTEALVKRVARLTKPQLLAESGRLSRDQARLRKVVSDVVFSRLGDNPGGEHFHGDGHSHQESEPLARALTPEELLKAAERATDSRSEPLDFAHDETPVVAINRPLLEAYNAMWEAGRSLDAGEPRAALPPMYVALAAIQKARAAERLYLRGASPRVVIDLAKVRLQGKDRGRDALMPARTPRSADRAVLWQRLGQILQLESAAAAADSVLLLRIGILAEYPAPAAGLDSLAALLREGRDATLQVMRVRRALGGQRPVADSVAAWVIP